MKKQNFAILIILLSFILVSCGTQQDESMEYYSNDTVTSGQGITGFGASEAPMMMDAGIEMKQASVEVSEESMSNSNDPLVQSNRKLIRTVDLSVETNTFDTTMEELSASVAELNGYLEQSNIGGRSMLYEDENRSAYIIARIPAQNLDTFLSKVKEATNITYQNEHIADVTLQYNDVESRKKTLEIEQERIWELLE